MRVSRTALFGVLLCTAVGRAPAVHAQHTGGVELGAFGGLTLYDATMTYENTVGAGVRLNVFLLPYVGLEGEAAYTETKNPSNQVLSHALFRARLLFDISPMPWSVLRRVHFLVGAGAVHNEYRLLSSGADTGPTGLGGLRVDLIPALSLRMEAVADYIPNTVLVPTAADEPSVDVLHWTFRPGLSLHLRFRGGSNAVCMAVATHSNVS
jgi:hypothetical protein